MQKKYDVIRITVSDSPFAQATDKKTHFWKVGKNLTLEQAQKVFDEEEKLSKTFADGTYHKIVESPIL